MRIFHTDAFTLPLPEGHRFPMSKYALLRERVARLAPQSLEVPPAASDAELAHAHDPGYVARVVEGRLSAAEQRRIGFPWSAELVERSRRSAGATLAAAGAALEAGCAISLAGGTHHAFADHGEGYCVFNDTAVAARVLRARGRVARTLVVDLDVHQGNGTAAILRGDPGAFTFSVHGARNYPLRKEAGDWDIELEDDTGDDQYLDRLARTLPELFARAGPDLAIYIAGADPFEGDRLGRLALSKAGLEARDRLVLAACRERGVPVVVTMGGGYGERVEDTVDIHFATVRAALELVPGAVRAPRLPGEAAPPASAAGAC